MSKTNIQKDGCKTFVFFVFVFFTPLATANLFSFNLPAEIIEADMDICNASKCLILKTPKITVSAVDRNYSFENAVIEMRFKNSLKNEFKVEAGEGYLDQKASVLLLKKLKGPYRGQELLINIDKLQANFSKR